MKVSTFIPLLSLILKVRASQNNIVLGDDFISIRQQAAYELTEHGVGDGLIPLQSFFLETSPLDSLDMEVVRTWNEFDGPYRLIDLLLPELMINSKRLLDSLVGNNNEFNFTNYLRIDIDALCLLFDGDEPEYGSFLFSMLELIAPKDYKTILLEWIFNTENVDINDPESVKMFAEICYKHLNEEYRSDVTEEFILLDLPFFVQITENHENDIEVISMDDEEPLRNEALEAILSKLPETLVAKHRDTLIAMDPQEIEEKYLGTYSQYHLLDLYYPTLFEQELSDCFEPLQGAMRNPEGFVRKAIPVMAMNLWKNKKGIFEAVEKVISKASHTSVSDMLLDLAKSEIKADLADKEFFEQILDRCYSAAFAFFADRAILEAVSLKLPNYEQAQKEIQEMIFTGFMDAFSTITNVALRKRILKEHYAFKLPRKSSRRN